MTKLMLGDKSYRNIYYRGTKQNKVVLDGLTIFSAPDLSGAPSGPFTEDGDKFYRDTTLALARGNYETYYNEAKNDCDEQTDGTWLCTDGTLAIGDVNGGTTTGAYDPAFNDDTSGTNSGGSTSGGGSTAPAPGDIAGSANIKTRSGMMNETGTNANGADGHASYNSTHHNRLQIYQDGSGNWKQSWAYYADGGPGDQGDCVVTNRDFPSGAWSTPKSVHSAVMLNAHNDPNWNFGVTGGVGELDKDNHNNLSMAVTDSGIHLVCGNMHASWAHIAYSPANNINGSWTNISRNDFGDDPNYGNVSADRLTYPCLFNYKGKVWLSARGQKSGGGKNNAPWHWTLWEFNESTKKMDFRSTIEYAPGARAYMSNVSTVDLPGGGERMGITGFFRNEVQGGSAAHYDLYHFYSDDGTNWRQHNLTSGGNVNANTPVTFYIIENSGGSNTGNAPVKIWDTVGRNDPQQSAFASSYNTVDGTPLIWCRSRSDGHFHFTHGSSGWQSQVGKGGIDDTTRYVTMADGTVWGIWCDGGNVKATNMTSGVSKTLVSGKTNNNYTMIIDEEAKKYGWLSMAVFQGGVSAPNDGYCVSIPLGDLETFNNPY